MMKLFKYFIFSALFVIPFIFPSCGETQQKSEGSNKQSAVKKDTSEALKLIMYLEEMGDYVNGRNFPSLIKASSVFEEMDGNIHIIDMRHADVYNKGHIKNAVNVRFNNLPNHFENEIIPFEFDKIILVCYGGQIASYSASLLRLMGYGNVYSMRWGMSAWNEKFAKDYWLSGVSSKFQDQIEKESNTKTERYNLPDLNTGMKKGEDIHSARFESIFKEGLKDVFVSADQVFENPENYYIINYDRKDKYLAGHIPGSIRYKPNATLGIVSEMETIPVDKDVVVYCGTGHNSGFVTAYLRLLGYNAQTLEHGANSFMYDKMIEDRATLSWLPFTDQEIHNYHFVTE
ncbi:MAG: hypothetical protein C0597_10910 [Marinilabiliales bacterium]|nr:MAG: hypothetical protein C0597_10910 [Marinilabiliales bacterium]